MIEQILTAAIPIILAITLHEVAHGWVAYQFGDATAKNAGRLTINPVKHIDPIGTVLVPGLMMITTGFMFGWAKPVPVDWRNLHNPKRDMIFVAAAGPFANLLMAIFWAIEIKLSIMAYPTIGTSALVLWSLGVNGILINGILMILNLFPIPPLDGGRVVTGLLPLSLARYFARIEPVGLIIVLALVFTGLLGDYLCSPVTVFQNYLAEFFGFNPGLLINLNCG